MRVFIARDNNVTLFMIMVMIVIMVTFLTYVVVVGHCDKPQLWLNSLVCCTGFNTWPQQALLLHRHQLPKERAGTEGGLLILCLFNCVLLLLFTYTMQLCNCACRLASNIIVMVI